MIHKSIQLEKKTPVSSYLVKTIFTSLLFFFAFTANLNAQGDCFDPTDPSNGCDPTPQTMIVAGYTITYFNCPTGIAISSITYQGLTTPGLAFINVVIPALLGASTTGEITYEAACAKWKSYDCKRVRCGGYVDANGNYIEPPIGQGEGWGIWCKYKLVNCGMNGCCKWDPSGAGMPQGGLGMGYGGSCPDSCFPMCDNNAGYKMARTPFKGDDLITISPNPAQDFIQFNHINHLHSVIIYDAVGKVVYSQAPTQKIDISKYNNGLYFVQLNRVDGLSEARKFEKK